MDKKNIRELLSQPPFTKQPWWQKINEVLNQCYIPDPSKSREENNLISLLFCWMAFENLSKKEQLEFTHPKTPEIKELVEALKEFAAGVSEETASRFIEELTRQLGLSHKTVKTRANSKK